MNPSRQGFCHRIALLLWLPISLHPQTPGQQLSLSECIRRALTSHPDLLLTRAQVAAASAELTAAFGSYLPSVSLSAGYSRQLNVEGGRSINVGGQIIRLPSVEPNTYSLSLIGSYVLFDGFGREGNLQRAQAAVKSAEAQLAYTRQRIATEVIRQYTEVLKAEKLLFLRQRHYEVGKQELERVRAFVEVGRQPRSALLAQEAELARREVALLQAQQQYELAAARLRSFIGVSPTEQARFADPTIPDSLSPEEARRLRHQWGSFAALLQQALTQRQDYIAAQQRVTAISAALTSARSGYFPTLLATGGWSWANSALRDFSQLGRSFISLQLNVPLFENFRTHAQIQAAELQLQQAQAELEKLRQTVTLEVQTALLNLDALLGQLEAAFRSLQAAEDYAESLRQRYEVGTATQTEYLAAEAQRVEAATTLVTLSYDYYAALAQLRLAVGSGEP